MTRRASRSVRPIPPELLRRIMRDDINDNRPVPTSEPMLPAWAWLVALAIASPFLAAFLSWWAQ